MNRQLDFSDLRERVIWIINEWTPVRGRYPYLEQKTGINARKWQNVCNRAQQPTVEMLSALAKARPYFMSWLLIGEAYKRRQINPTDPNFEDEVSKEILGLDLPPLSSIEISEKNVSDEELERSITEFVKLMRNR